MRKDLVREVRAREEHASQRPHIQRSPGHRVQHGQEDTKEEERAAQVAQEHDHEHRDSPHCQHRREVWKRRQLERADPVLGGEQVAALVEIRGEEEDQYHLEDLAGLEGGDTEVVPQPGPLYGRLRDEPEHEQHPERRECVPVPAGRLESPEQSHGCGQHRHPDEHPDSLPDRDPRQFGTSSEHVEPLHKHEPDARKQRDDRED